MAVALSSTDRCQWRTRRCRTSTARVAWSSATPPPCCARSGRRSRLQAAAPDRAASKWAWTSRLDAHEAWTTATPLTSPSPLRIYFSCKRLSRLCLRTLSSQRYSVYVESWSVRLDELKVVDGRFCWVLHVDLLVSALSCGPYLTDPSLLLA